MQQKIGGVQMVHPRFSFCFQLSFDSLLLLMNSADRAMYVRDYRKLKISYTNALF